MADTSQSHAERTIRFVTGTISTAQHARGRIAQVHIGPPRLAAFERREPNPSGVLTGAGPRPAPDLSVAAVIEAGFPAAVVRDFAVASGLSIADVSRVLGTS